MRKITILGAFLFLVGITFISLIGTGVFAQASNPTPSWLPSPVNPFPFPVKNINGNVLPANQNFYPSDSLYSQGYNQGIYDLVLRINSNGDIPIITKDSKLTFIPIKQICADLPT